MNHKTDEANVELGQTPTEIFDIISLPTCAALMTKYPSLLLCDKKQEDSPGPFLCMTSTCRSWPAWYPVNWHSNLIPADDPLHPITLEDAGYSRKPRAGEAVGGVKGGHQQGVRTNNIGGQFHMQYLNTCYSPSCHTYIQMYLYK